MTFAIRTEELTKRFGKVSVLDGLNIDVPEGAVYGLIGSNGAGKTTAIKIMMNILRANSGRATVLGVDSQELGYSQFVRIGYVSENQEMPEWMTVRYFLRYLRPFYSTWDEARVKELLQLFQLPLDRELRHLSRGMRMKVSLISSTAYHPQLLVLDEPFSGLDAVIREDLIRGTLLCADDCTTFISSHDLAEIESFASHIGYLENGKLQFSEEMESLSSRFRQIEVTTQWRSELPTGSEWPANWLAPEATSAFVRFIETQFEADRTRQDIRRVFGETLEISEHPMPLRSIFLTLARATTPASSSQNMPAEY
jgi:ABC-2 type transport system ATP-binding protein